MAILSVQRRLEIENQARKVFEKYRHLVEDLCSEEVGPRGVIPVQTRLIISKLYGAQLLVVRDMPNERGLFRAGSYDGTDVLISENQTAGAKRFTEAHEIAHMHLHPGEAHLRERSGDLRASRALKEHEADCFATNLLMPHELASEEFIDRFRGSLAARTIDDDSAYALTAGKLLPSQIRRMSCKRFAELIAKTNWFDGRHFDFLKDVFGVSAEAMAWRLIELRLVSQD